MTLLGWLALYALVGAVTGCFLCLSRKDVQFTPLNQVAGAIIWPATLGVFCYSFVKSYLGRRA